MSQNLEELIEDHAETMAARMVRAAEWAASEEDIRHEVNTLIDRFISEAGLTVKGRHEYGLAGGRIDSKYGGVVIEYKAPKGAGRLTEDRNAPGVKAVVKQIRQRFQDLQTAEHVGMERILGVGCDGDTVVFARMRGTKVAVEDPQPVTAHNVERLLRAVVSLGARGLSFTPENLATHFGAQSASAQEGVRLIHGVVHGTDSAKAQTFFRQWQILFGEVCGYDLHGRSAKVRKLAQHYDVPEPDPAELLFAVHTYYAVFIKLLAAEIVASFSPLGTSTLRRLIEAPTSEKLRDELRNLEQGGIWSQLGIHNFLEGDLFSWYLDAWGEPCVRAVRAMTRSLDQFDPTTLSVDPAESRDLLKHLYQQLFPKSVRHDLGEYYTPDWLAELVLDELGYDGNPDKRLLDPACGSGTFLVMALNRAKAWYEEHRHACGFGEGELLRKVSANIVGFDLNPLAVMAARTNYLLAVRDLVRHADALELPVYLCDSILTPSEYGDVFTGGFGKVRRLRTSAGDFNIPNEIAENRDQIARYADALEFCIRNRYATGEFLERCHAEGIPVAKRQLHAQLYEHLQDLDADNKNGVWARIIKNAFAPVFVGKVDYVAGNPPWVNWENLPEGYRDGMKPLWVKYGLFSLKGHAARLGGGKKDLSIIFTYAALDAYLADGGRLGFVITQSVFKTKGAGDGFRRLRFDKDGRTVHLKPVQVHDLSAIQVFEGATNRTAVLVCEKRTSPFAYPVPYTAWRGPSRLGQDVSLQQARAAATRSRLTAAPVDPDKPSSPWLTAPEQALSGIHKVIGKSDYRAYEGVNTGGLNGCYWVRVLDKRPNGDLLIENLHDVGKLKVDRVQAVVEPDLVYPLLRGRDVRRWHAAPSAHIILAQDPDKRAGIPEPEMKRRWPKTYAYLKRFEGDPDNPQRGTLRGRSAYRKYYEPTDPFYSMYGVGPYTMARWRTAWKGQVATSLDVSVCGPGEDGRPVLNDQTAYSVPFEEEREAHYLAALLNSRPVRAFYGCLAYKHTSMAFIAQLAMQTFERGHEVHEELTTLSQQCHAAAAHNDEAGVAELEARIDAVAARIWGITDAELAAIREALEV